MKSRFVRFAAPSFGPDSKAETATATIAPPAPGDGGAFSSDGNNGVAPTSAFAHRRPSVTVNAPSEIPSLASALAQSVRHHSRLVDGEHSSPIPMPVTKPQHKSLATGNYLDISSNKNSWESYTVQRGSVMSSARRPSLDDTVVTGSSRGARVIDSRSSFQMQHEHERGESFNLRNGRNRGFGEASENDNRYTSFGPGQTVDYNVPFVSPVPKADSLPGSSSNGSSSHNLIAPPPWAHHLFSTAMRHSSNFPIPSEHSNNSECSDASRRFFASRKNRHDSSLRFIVLVTCFGLSLMFAIFYGEGKFGLALANMAYEVKVTHMYGTANITNPNVQEKVSKGELVYPEWWDNQKGIPNMRAKGIQFSAALDNHTADVSQPRPPGRVDTPFFWFTTRSRGNVIRAIMSNCFHLVEASGFGKDSIQPVSA